MKCGCTVLYPGMSQSPVPSPQVRTIAREFAAYAKVLSRDLFIELMSGANRELRGPTARLVHDNGGKSANDMAAWAVMGGEGVVDHCAVRKETSVPDACIVTT